MSDEVETPDEQVEVSPATFEEMEKADVQAAVGVAERDDDLVNLDLIMDVAVPVTVSVGSVRKRISEILAMTPGHVVDLNRFAGDPVDLVVNGKVIARGEVVVVDDHYGMRITEIVAPRERVQQAV